MKTYQEIYESAVSTMCAGDAFEYAWNQFKTQHFQQYRTIYKQSYLEQVWEFCDSVGGIDQTATRFHTMMQLIIVGASYQIDEF